MVLLLPAAFPLLSSYPKSYPHYPVRQISSGSQHPLKICFQLDHYIFFCFDPSWIIKFFLYERERDLPLWIMNQHGAITYNALHIWLKHGGDSTLQRFHCQGLNGGWWGHCSPLYWSCCWAAQSPPLGSCEASISLHLHHKRLYMQRLYQTDN